METSDGRHRDDRIDALVCDLDGVVYRGSSAIAGVPEAIDRFREAGIRVVFCTNNSRPGLDEYVERLGRFGVTTAPDEIVTSAVVTGEVLAARGLGGASAIVVGGDGVREALRAAGIKVLDDPEAREADVVVVGVDASFSYDSMKRASLAVRAGATFIATNDDATFPASDGLWPGAGAILASIETASGRKAEVMGKPHPSMMDVVAKRLGSVQRVAIVGDRPDTDLAAGAARGWTTILVLTGVVTPDEAPHVEPTPDIVVDSLADLPALLLDQ
jgi:phosphoglycolate/pyridoxal phosphate phosphatase family enzyme